MVWLLLAPAWAVDPQTLWAGLEEAVGWEVVHRKHFDDVNVDVVVELKRIGGQPCLKATTSAAVSPDVLLHLASDIPNQPSWSTWKVPVAERLSGHGSSFDFVEVLDNPYPVDDRIWFAKGSISRIGESRIFRWDRVDAGSAYPDKLAELSVAHPDLVETTVNLGDWTFTPDGELTTIRYRICTNPGGSLPQKAGEFAAKSTLPTNLADIVRQARRLMGR